MKKLKDYLKKLESNNLNHNLIVLIRMYLNVLIINVKKVTRDQIN